jgi:predicted transcriptional regulator
VIDYSEIAEATGLNAQTIAQIISALEAGGYPIQFVYDAVQRRGEIGRKPVLVRKKVKTNPAKKKTPQRLQSLGPPCYS